MSTSREIVITGVSRGLGRALTEWFVTQGHSVSGAARSVEAIQALNEDPGPAGAFSILDLLDRSAVEAWAASLPPPDLLICNAGVIHPDTPFVELDAETFDQQLDVNVKGTANTLRAFLPKMLTRGIGTIIVFTSGAGIKGYPEISGYCASKHALEGLCKSIALELPEGMAIIPYQPGVIQTDMLVEHYGERAREYPLPEEWVKVAGPALLSLGPDQNGQSLRLAL